MINILTAITGMIALASVIVRNSNPADFHRPDTDCDTGGLLRGDA